MPSCKDRRCRRSVAALLALAVLGACATPAHAHGDHAIVDRHKRAFGKSVAVKTHLDSTVELSAAASAVALRQARRTYAVRSQAPSLGGSSTGTGADWLADSWCGTLPLASQDDTADAVSPSAPVIKVIYARPSDQADRFASQYKDVIQQQVKTASGLVYSSGGALKSLRFDLGTPCGSAYVDVQNVVLPRTLAEFQALPAGPDATHPLSRFDAIVNDVHAAVSSTAQTRDYLIYADYLGGGGFPAAGQAELIAGNPGDDRPDASNPSNAGGLNAIVYGTGGAYFSSSNQAFANTVPLHEITHMLGGVQDSAPNSTQAGHCFDEWDVMCYADGGPKGQSSDIVVRCSDSAHEVYDCNQDDYFNPAPAIGSYLATHWNVFSSVFLCATGTCGTPVASPPPPAPTSTTDSAGSSTTVIPGGDTTPPAQSSTATTSSAPLSPGALARAVGLARAGAGVAVRTRGRRTFVALGYAHCPSVCRGSVSLYALRDARLRHTVSLGRQTFDLRPGRGAQLGIELSAGGRRLLRSRGRLTAGVTLGVRNGYGTTWVTRTFTLRAA